MKTESVRKVRQLLDPCNAYHVEAGWCYRPWMPDRPLLSNADKVGHWQYCGAVPPPPSCGILCDSTQSRPQWDDNHMCQWSTLFAQSNNWDPGCGHSRTMYLWEVAVGVTLSIPVAKYIKVEGVNFKINNVKLRENNKPLLLSPSTRLKFLTWVSTLSLWQWV